MATYTATDPERDTITWSVNNDGFYVSNRGQLYFAQPPSYEDGTSHSVTITATDDHQDGSRSGSLDVAVTLTDAEEEGTVTVSPLSGWVGTQFGAALTDGDGDVTGIAWQWARSLILQPRFRGRTYVDDHARS